MQGKADGQEYAVKLYDNRTPQAVAAYFHEKACLLGLKSCSSVVRVQMAGRLQDSLYPCIVTTLAGSPSKQLCGSKRAAASRALRALHTAGAAHGDVRLPNLLFSMHGVCQLADLADCVLNASSQAKKRDIQQLNRL